LTGQLDQRWSLELGPVVKMNRPTKRTIRSDEENQRFENKGFYNIAFVIDGTPKIVHLAVPSCVDVYGPHLIATFFFENAGGILESTPKRGAGPQKLKFELNNFRWYRHQGNMSDYP
jgi:hypothetical protein